MTYNVGSAILILGSIYLHLVHGLNGWITFGLCLIALLSWAYVGFTREREHLLEAQIRLANAKASYYEKKGESG